MRGGEPRDEVRFGIHSRRACRATQRLLCGELVDNYVDSGYVRMHSAVETAAHRARPCSVNMPACRRRHDFPRDQPCAGRKAIVEASRYAEADDRACTARHLTFERDAQLLSLITADHCPHSRAGGNARFNGKARYGNDAHMPERTRRLRDWRRLR